MILNNFSYIMAAADELPNMSDDIALNGLVLYGRFVQKWHDVHVTFKVAMGKAVPLWQVRYMTPFLFPNVNENGFR